MPNQYYLQDALARSPERIAFRIAPFRDVWEVRVEDGENPYTLIHHLSSTGERGDPLTHVPLYYRTLEDLLEDQDKRDEAVLGLSDWYPDNEETRQWFKTESPHANYPAPGYYPSSL